MHGKKTFKNKCEKQLTILTKAIRGFEDLEKEYSKSMAQDVPEAAVMLLARKMDMLFGNPMGATSYMYGVTATMVGVLFDSAGIQVTADGVRNIVHSGPWKITYRMSTL